MKDNSILIGRLLTNGALISHILKARVQASQLEINCMMQKPVVRGGLINGVKNHLSDKYKTWGSSHFSATKL